MPFVAELGQFESGIIMDACPIDLSASRGSNTLVEAEGRQVSRIDTPNSEQPDPDILDPLETPTAEIVDQEEKSEYVDPLTAAHRFREMWCRRSDIERTGAQQDDPLARAVMR